MRIHLLSKSRVPPSLRDYCNLGNARLILILHVVSLAVHCNNIHSESTLCLGGRSALTHNQASQNITV